MFRDAQFTWSAFSACIFVWVIFTRSSIWRAASLSIERASSRAAFSSGRSRSWEWDTRQQGQAQNGGAAGRAQTAAKAKISKPNETDYKYRTYRFENVVYATQSAQHK